MIGALDVGGTHVTAARVDLASASVEAETRCRVPLDPDGERSELLDGLRRAAVAIAGPGTSRVGVAVPGPFDYERGIPILRHKLAGLYGVDLRRELAAALDLADAGSVRFLNDADAFLLGEWWAGAARGHARAVGITLGTGLGSAFLAEGRILRAGPGVPPDGALHLVPFRGAPVEDRISRRALLVGSGAGSDESVDVAELAERARAGEPRARESFRAVASDLAEFLEPPLSAFAPSCLVVGGSIARAWDLIGPVVGPALEAVKELEVVTVAANLDDAPLLGAARHVAGPA